LTIHENVIIFSNIVQGENKILLNGHLQSVLTR